MGISMQIRGKKSPWALLGRNPSDPEVSWALLGQAPQIRRPLGPLGTRDQGRGTRDQWPGARDQGPGTRDHGIMVDMKTMSLWWIHTSLDKSDPTATATAIAKATAGAWAPSPARARSVAVAQGGPKGGNPLTPGSPLGAQDGTQDGPNIGQKSM